MPLRHARGGTGGSGGATSARPGGPQSGFGRSEIISRSCCATAARICTVSFRASELCDLQWSQSCPYRKLVHARARRGCCSTQRAGLGDCVVGLQITPSYLTNRHRCVLQHRCDWRVGKLLGCSPRCQISHMQQSHPDAEHLGRDLPSQLLLEAAEHTAFLRKLVSRLAAHSRCRQTATTRCLRLQRQVILERQSAGEHQTRLPPEGLSTARRSPSCGALYGSVSRNRSARRWRTDPAVSIRRMCGRPRHLQRTKGSPWRAAATKGIVVRRASAVREHVRPIVSCRGSSIPPVWDVLQRHCCRNARLNDITSGPTR